MLMFASLLGMVAVVAAAFVGFQPETAEIEDTPEIDDAGNDISVPDLIEGAFGSNEGVDSEGPTSSAGVTSGTPDAEAIFGTGGSDQINGFAKDDTISRASGNDILYGDFREDCLFGEDGNDTLHGGDGADDLFGGNGSDQIFGHNGTDKLSGGEGDDSLVGSAGNDLLRGDDGNDALHGDLDDDTLHGGHGNDTLFGGWGNDTLIGTVGNPDTAIHDDLDGRDYLNGGGGADLILVGLDDMVDAGDGADTIMLGDWITANDVAEILDFQIEDDALVVFYDAESNGNPTLSLEHDTRDGNGQTLLLNGAPIATIQGAAGLTLDHILLLPQSAMAGISGL